MGQNMVGITELYCTKKKHRGCCSVIIELLLKYIEVYSLVTVAEFISLTADHSQGVGAVYDPLSQSGGCGTEYYS